MASARSDDRTAGLRRPLSDIADRLSVRAEWHDWPAPIVVETTPTTMAVVVELARQGGVEGTAVIAEEQTGGRGRHGRSWDSPLHCGLWVSMLWRPPASSPLSDALLPLMTGLAVCDALRHFGAGRIAVKWPNDVVVERSDGVGKLAGILAERMADGAIVMGIGINVLQTQAELPPGASSLLIEVPGLSASRDEVGAMVLARVAQGYRRWCSGEWNLAEYRAGCITIGRRVRVHHVSDSEGAEIHGLAVGVDDQGRLLVEVEGEAEPVAVSAGDVTLGTRHDER